MNTMTDPLTKSERREQRMIEQYILAQPHWHQTMSADLAFNAVPQRMAEKRSYGSLIQTAIFIMNGMVANLRENGEFSCRPSQARIARKTRPQKAGAYNAQAKGIRTITARCADLRDAEIFHIQQTYHKEVSTDGTVTIVPETCTYSLARNGLRLLRAKLGSRMAIARAANCKARHEREAAKKKELKLQRRQDLSRQIDQDAADYANLRCDGITGTERWECWDRSYRAKYKELFAEMTPEEQEEVEMGIEPRVPLLPPPTQADREAEVARFAANLAVRDRLKASA